MFNFVPAAKCMRAPLIYPFLAIPVEILNILDEPGYFTVEDIPEKGFTSLVYMLLFVGHREGVHLEGFVQVEHIRMQAQNVTYKRRPRPVQSIQDQPLLLHNASIFLSTAPGGSNIDSTYTKCVCFIPESVKSPWVLKD